MATTPTLGHILYGHLSSQGLQLLASPQVSSHLQTYFLETLVQPHWNPSSPPPVGYRAAFLHQCDLPTEQVILFGWLYSDPPPGSPISSPTPLQPLVAVGADEMEGQAEIPAARSVALLEPNSSGPQPSSSSSPCFIAYLLPAPLQEQQLNQILEFLEQGPDAMTMAPFAVEPLAQVFLAGPPPWPRAGVLVPSGIRARSRLLLNKGKPLSFFVPVNFTPTEIEVTPENAVQTMISPPPVLAPTQVRPKSLAVRAENTLARLDPSEDDTELGPPKRSLQAPTQVLPYPSKPSALPQGSQMAVPKISRKLALLIGVNHYGDGFNALPGVEADLSEMKRVLEDSQLGEFAQVVSILNPDCQQMSDAIESLFLSCHPDDLVLFYFSGYCVHDSLGKSCLTTGLSRLGNGNQVVRASVIPIDFLTAVMGDSPSCHQVVVIDYGVNTAIAQDRSFRNAAWWQLEEQLAGQERAILTSGPPSQCTVHQKVNDRSLYTRYLVEGLETGMADLDGNGLISLHEWHEYARRRTLRASPALKPQLLASNRLLDTAIAPASVDNPILIYRRHVEWCAEPTGISSVHRVVLEHLRAHLNLSDAEAKRIEVMVLRPYHHYQAKVQSYTRAVIEGLLSKGEIKRLKVVHNPSLRALQATLGLTDRDVSPIEATLFSQQRLAQRRSGVNAQTQWARRIPSQNAPLLWYGYYRWMTWLRSRWMVWGEWMGQCHLRVVRVLRHLFQANPQLVLVLLRRHLAVIVGAIVSLIIAIILLMILF